MKKILLSLFMMLSTLSIMAGVEALPITVEEAIAGDKVVTLCVGDKYLYGANAQNCAMGTPAEAVAEKNAVIGFKLEEGDGGYLFRAVTPNGGDYSLWGASVCYLNSQSANTGVTFILGKNTDIANGSVWTFEADGSLKCIANGGYFNGVNMSATPVAVSLVELVGEPEPEPEPDPVVFPASLESLVENGTVFTLKFGDQYLYGTEQQGIGAGDWDAACAEANNANGYVLEKNEDGYAFLRAVKTDGSNITAWGTTPCYLNAQPAVTGVIFNLGKDQDFKNGSTWIITEVEGGYTIQNLGNKGYLSGNGLSETPAVWEFYVPGEEPLDLTISPAFIVEGEEEIVTLNDHSSVSVPSANALKVNFGDNAAVKYATYVINELVEEEFMGQVNTFEDEVATGTLSINTIGYAEFEEPLTFYYGHKYNILIKAWDVDENNLFDENFIMASPIATFTAEFNGSTDETPAGEDIVVTPSFVLDGEEIALNDHSTVSVEVADAIKVAFENAQPTEVNYVINEMVQSESEEGTSWAAGEEIASGTLSVNGIAYAEFANPLTFVSGKKYQLTVSAIAQTQELGSYTYEFNGAYVAPEMAEIADGVYRIFNMEAEKFLSNGAYWGTRAVLSDNGISYNVVRNLENGKYTLKSGIKGDAKALRPTDGFNDQSGEWEIYKYDNNGGVVLFNGEKYFSYDGTTNIPQFVDEPTDASVWQFVSEQALKDMIATATPNLPMDATIYVKGADFLNGDVANAAWAGNKVGGDNGQGNTKINNTNCEAWNKGSFTISQTITDLPNGFYSLTAFGYYREGNRDVASSVDAYENGTENASILSANDKSVALKSVYSEAKTAAEGGWAVESAASSEGNVYFIPNSQAEAAACFEAGAYVNEIKNIEVTDGTLTISVSREGEAIFDWTVFDNVRLTYYGTEPADEQTIDASLINGEEIIALNSHSSVSAEKTEGIEVRFGIPTAVESASYAIMPLVQVEGEEGTSWVPGANITTGDLSINTVAYAEVAYTFEKGTKYQIDINVTYKDGTDEKASFTVDGATEVEPTTLDGEIALNGTELSVVFPVGTDLGDNYTEKPYIKAGEEVIEIADYTIDNTTGEFFDPLNKIIINLKNELATGDYTLVIPAGTFIVNGGDNNSEIAIPFKVESTKPEIIGESLKLMPGANSNLPLPEDAVRVFTFNSQWSNTVPNVNSFDASIYKEVVIEFKEALPFYYNTPYKDATGAQMWGGVAAGNTEYRLDLEAIGSITEFNIQNTQESNTPDNSFAITKAYAVKQDGTEEPIFFQAPGWGGSMAVEADIYSANVTFNGQWANIGIDGLKDVEGKKIVRIYTNTPINPDDVQFCIRTTDGADAWPQIALQDDTKCYGLAEINETLESIALQWKNTEAGSMDIVAVTVEVFAEPKAVVADMKFNVAEDANLDEDGEFKVEFTYAATMNAAAEATFPSGMIAYKVTDAEDNVVAETETDFDFALTSRNIYLKNLEAGQTYTLTATKIYGAGLDMTTFETVEIPTTITGELPTITFTVPGDEEEMAIETSLLYGEEEITLNSHTNISADQIQAIKVNFIGMPNVTSASYSIAPMTKVESAEGTSWTPNADEATTGELSINTIGYAEVDYKFEQGTKYQITVKATLQDGTEVTETYEINGSTATYSGYIASTGMLLSTGVSKSFEQPETISVNSKEISFENVFIPVVNIATGDFTIPVTTETDATGNTIYRAQEVDVDLHDVYYSGGQDDAVPFKAWLIGIESTDGPILFVHLQSNLQDIFIAYNALLKDAIWMMSEITPEDVNAGGAKVLNFLEATSINSVATDAKANGKYLENGKVIIVNKDKKYNVNGAIIK